MAKLDRRHNIIWVEKRVTSFHRALHFNSSYYSIHNTYYYI